MPQAAQSKSPMRWRNFLVKSTVWLSSEIVLGLMGLDTLADYGEFLSHSRMAIHLSDAIATITTLM